MVVVVRFDNENKENDAGLKEMVDKCCLNGKDKLVY